MRDFTFWLGTHKPHHLGETAVPLFFSHRQLVTRVTLKRAAGMVAWDSGGFSYLHDFGRYPIGPEEYVGQCLRWRDQVGRQPEFVAIQDWMCEPLIVNGGTYKSFGRTVTVPGTKLTVGEHQRRTIGSYLRLNGLAPDLPWLPVLQGYAIDEYLDHVDQYAAAGLPLQRFGAVGVGSICRRQGTAEAEELMRRLHGLGIAVHGFGFKIDGLRRAARWMRSSDSTAWSFDARFEPPLPGCRHGKSGRGNCNNCLLYAVEWRKKPLAAVAESFSMSTSC